MIITIDGPAASGKTTMARALAIELGYRYVDTGAFYRCIALCTKNSNHTPNIEDLLSKLDITATYIAGRQVMTINNHQIEDGLLRLEEIGNEASKISELEPVRHRVNTLVRAYISDHDCILEGRDTGSVVCPDADAKFYLTAMRYVRAERRYMDLLARGEHPAYSALYNQLGERDDRDSTRLLDPLMIPDDAHVIDNTHMTEYDVLTTMSDIVNEIINTKEEA